MKRKLKIMFFKFFEIYKKYIYTYKHQKELRSYCKNLNLKLERVSNEEAYIEKWRKLYKFVKPDFYRFYSLYIGADINLLSDEVFHLAIEPVLNSQKLLSSYSDKNFYDKFIDSSLFPECILRNVDSIFMDKRYFTLSMNQELFEKMIIKNERLIEKGKIILKPSLDSCGGKGVRLFTYVPTDGKWISNDNEELSLSFLKKIYKKDYLLQCCIETSSFLKKFNPTSYNTLRIITYKSVKNEQVHILGAYLRVGAKGSFKDNVHEGGYACYIDDEGKLDQYAFNELRSKYDFINEVSLINNNFFIPNYSTVKSIIMNVAENIVANRVLSFDVILDVQNNPHIIEINFKNQTITSIQMMKKSFFGEFTDEVIDFCLKHKNVISY